MIEVIDIDDTPSLDRYAEYVQLRPTVEVLREEAKMLAPALEGRRVWMVNSTAEGGGVAEMLPKLVALLRELGVPTEWAVIQPTDARFFDLTKRLHNLIHDSGDPAFSDDDRALYEKVSREAADAFAPHLADGDVLAVHDPQPLGMGAVLKERLGLPALWRCHIGLDHQTERTRAVWNFLRPFTERYDRVVFSVPDYVPGFLKEKAETIPPAIDPLSHKNRALSVHKLSGVLCNAEMADAHQPVLTPSFPNTVQRVQPDGSFAAANEPEELGLLFRPIVMQVSRWDGLKGFVPLLEGFTRLKKQHHARHSNGTADGAAPAGSAYGDDHEKHPARHQRRLDLVRLVLAGPDPASVQDDPEGMAVFEKISHTWQELPPEIQKDVAILMLPMNSRKQNALMVNALQRCSTVVVQNSLQEGFGLTATEAMWKGCPVMGTRAVGLRTQIRDGVEGRLVQDAEDPDEIATVLDEMLSDPKEREVWSRNARRRVSNHYLVFSQARRWLEATRTCCEASMDAEAAVA